MATGRVVVTGHNGYLGTAIAAELVKRGWDVVGVDKARSDGLPDNRQFACDLRDATAIGGTIDRIRREAGPIDALVNNAGVMPPEKPLSVEVADFDAVYAINVRAAYFMTQAFARLRVEAGGDGGRIVNIASMAGLRASPLPVYASSKAAVISLTRSMAKQLALHRINVNAVAPGVVDGGMAGVLPDELRHAAAFASVTGRLVAPSDVAGAVGFLLGPEADNVSGTTIEIDGGARP